MPAAVMQIMLQASDWR